MEHNLKKSEDTIQNQTADLQKDYYLYLTKNSYNQKKKDKKETKI